MTYDVSDVKVSSSDIDNYLDTLINKVFAILGIYEDCEKINNFNNYNIYLGRILVELKGFAELVDVKDFISLYNIIYGMTVLNNLDHKKVKSTVFHCISIIKTHKGG